MAACCQMPFVGKEEHSVCGKKLTFINPFKNNLTDSVLIAACNIKKGNIKKSYLINVNEYNRNSSFL